MCKQAKDKGVLVIAVSLRIPVGDKLDYSSIERKQQWLFELAHAKRCPQGDIRWLEALMEASMAKKDEVKENFMVR